jgi:hypothetical protein
MDNKIVIEFCPIKPTIPLSVSYKKGKIYQMPKQMYHVVWKDGKNVGSLQIDYVTLVLLIKNFGLETNLKVTLEEFCGTCPNITINTLL